MRVVGRLQALLHEQRPGSGDEETAQFLVDVYKENPERDEFVLEVDPDVELDDARQLWHTLHTAPLEDLFPSGDEEAPQVPLRTRASPPHAPSPGPPPVSSQPAGTAVEAPPDVVCSPEAEMAVEGRRRERSDDENGIEGKKRRHTADKRRDREPRDGRKRRRRGDAVSECGDRGRKRRDDEWRSRGDDERSRRGSDGRSRRGDDGRSRRGDGGKSRRGDEKSRRDDDGRNRRGGDGSSRGRHGGVGRSGWDSAPTTATRPSSPTVKQSGARFPLSSGELGSVGPLRVCTIERVFLLESASGKERVDRACEGLASTEKVGSVSCSAGSTVFAKVTDVGESGQVSLSLVDADQKTGQDLRPVGLTGVGSLALGLDGLPLAAPTEYEAWECAQLGAGVGGLASIPDWAGADEEDYVPERVVTAPPFIPLDDVPAALGEPGSEGVRVGHASLSGELGRTALEAEALVRAKRGATAAKVPLWSESVLLCLRQPKVGGEEADGALPVPQLRGEGGRDLPLAEQRRLLPVYGLRGQLLNAVEESQALVVMGETGSGKTTQIPQYLLEEGYCSARKRIIVTQPRRVAATTVARRVAAELGCRVGADVGYSIRFDDRYGPNTRIVYATDGVVLRMMQLDPDLKGCAVLMLDEAHERTVSTDVLFALARALVRRRPDLRLLVTSATLNPTAFSRFFWDAPVFTIPGRVFPVDVFYSREAEKDYMEAAVQTCLAVHGREGPGDILVFMTGAEDVDLACDILRARASSLASAAGELLPLPVYAALPSEAQMRVFSPAAPGTRKVIVATNIAETSVTIDGVVFVVDAGLAKVMLWDAGLGMDSLQVRPISRAAALQRTGRAGRVQPGKCFRLYTEESFLHEMTMESIPEIQRLSLGHVVLSMKAIGVSDVLAFDFMDPPPRDTLVGALTSLHALGALNNEGELSALGLLMADFPLDPALSKTLVASAELGCAEEVLTVAAMLAAQNVWIVPKDRRRFADEQRVRLSKREGDHCTLLSVYEDWVAAGCSPTWARERFVNTRALRQAKDVRGQLALMMRRKELPITSCSGSLEIVCKAVCAGYFMQCAKRLGSTDQYKCVGRASQVLSCCVMSDL